MIYILKESYYNGTVTLGTSVLGIEAPDFNTAKAILRSNPSIRSIEESGGFTWEEAEGKLSYQIHRDFPCLGVLTDEPLEMMEDTR